MDSLPMVKVLVPFAAGIVLAENYVLPWWLIAAAFFVCGIVALLLRSQAAVVGLLLTAGWGMGQYRAPERSVPLDVPCVWEIGVEQVLSDRSGYRIAAGRILAWSPLPEGEWHPADDRVVLRIDSLTDVPEKSTVRCLGRVRPLKSSSESYFRAMVRQGYVGRLSLSDRDLLEVRPAKSPGLHAWAAARLKRCCSTGDAGAVVRAMTVADRSGVTPELRGAYSRSGLSHLLAVSGLHTGIVFLLANWALRWLVLLRRGHSVRDLLAVAAVWIYVAMAGWPPSAVRAAAMCSLLQLAIASGSRYAALNALAAAAFGMLLWNPAWIGDVGFQLSFVAVTAILLWALPLWRRLKTGRRVPDLLTANLTVALSATVATAPLVSHVFGIVPTLGVLLNPAAIPLAGITVFCGVAGLLVPGLPAVGEWAAWALNLLARTTASIPGSTLEYRLSAGATVGCYLLFAAATAVAAWRRRKKDVPLLP